MRKDYFTSYVVGVIGHLNVLIVDALSIITYSCHLTTLPVFYKYNNVELPVGKNTPKKS